MESSEVQPITPIAIIVQPQSLALEIIYQTPPTIAALSPLPHAIKSNTKQRNLDYNEDPSIRSAELLQSSLLPGLPPMPAKFETIF